MASMHVCPRCVGIWVSMDLALGFPSMRSLNGVICMLASQGVHWFMWWSIIVTWSLDVATEPFIFTILRPPRIRLPSLPRASPPSRNQLDVLASPPIGLGSVFSTSEYLCDSGSRSEWPDSQSGNRRCICLWVVYLFMGSGSQGPDGGYRGIRFRVSPVSL